MLLDNPYAQKLPAIAASRINAAGITIAYTHQGKPSSDLSSLIRMSINSFIIIRFCLLVICCRSRTRTDVMGLPFGTHHASPLHHTANRYRVLYYSHSIKPVPVAGREAHIHLCLVSVVRSSTSGPLVASDTDSSPAPSPRPLSLQFVAVGIRRPRRQS